MKISIGIVNFNRLFYLKAVTKSLTYSLDPEDLSNVELICIDDDSIEHGTLEYLDCLKKAGWNIIHQRQRRECKKIEAVDNFSHINPFSEALNIIYRESSGDLVMPVQGDAQFIRKGWYKEVINLFKNKQDVGVLLLDAQRRLRLENVSKFNHVNINGFDYFIDIKSTKIPGAGDCVYSRKLLNDVGGWTIKNGINSERNFTKKTIGRGLKKYSLKIPSMACIYTDPIGTNSRVRGGKRYGKYWQAENDQYYKFIDTNEFSGCLDRPYSIEEVVRADWELPIDKNGNWKKNPIEITASTECENIC